jgi:predicted ATPase
MYLTRVRVDSERFPTQRFYPFNVPVLRETPELVFRKPVVFFVGENGSGKSTLLEAITRKCGVHIWDKPRRHLAHHNPYETKLADYVSITRANGGITGSLFRAETFREFADFLDDVALCDPGRLQYHGGRILTTLSHGEPDQVLESVAATGERGPGPVHYRHPFSHPAGLSGGTDL